MTLGLRDTAEQPVVTMSDDDKSLHDYGCQNDYTIHVHYSGPNLVG